MSFEDRDFALLVGLGLLVALAVLTVAWRLVRKSLRTGRLSGPKLIILGGCLLFLLCGLFPPWIYTYSGGRTRSAGYSFIAIAPRDETRIDAVRLAVEWLCVLACAGMALVFTAKPGGGQGKAPEAADSEKRVATTPPAETETVEAATIQPTAKTESPSPPAVKTRRSLWLILTSLASLAIIVISLVVWLLPKPKPKSRSDKLPTWDETTPINQPKPKAVDWSEWEPVVPRQTDQFGGVLVEEKPKQQSNRRPITFIPDEPKTNPFADLIPRKESKPTR
jgi:hypothetical protein